MPDTAGRGRGGSRSDAQRQAAPASSVPGSSASRSSHRSGGQAAPERSGTRPWQRQSADARPAADTRAANDGDDADPDDPDLASSGLVGAPLVAQMLGGTVIDEIPEG